MGTRRAKGAFSEVLRLRLCDCSCGCLLPSMVRRVQARQRLEATVAALRHEKERSQPTQTEIAEIRTALEGLKANAHHWASRLVSGGVLARGTKPDLLPPRWTSALTIAAHFSTELHGKMLTIEDKAHHCERDIEDLCSVPESMRVSRQHQFIAVAQELSALGVQAAEAAGDLQQQRQPK